MVELRKYQVIKIVVIGLLLLGSGYIAALTLGVNPLARAKPEDRSLEELLDDMDVELLPGSKTQVNVGLLDISGNDVNIADYRGNIVFLKSNQDLKLQCLFARRELLLSSNPQSSSTLVAPIPSCQYRTHNTKSLTWKREGIRREEIYPSSCSTVGQR